MKTLASTLAIAVLAGGGLALTAALAQERASPLPPPPPSRTGLPTGQCVLSRDIRNHSIADRNTLLMDVNNVIYRVTITNNCLAGATNSDPIVIRHVSTYICKPIDLDVSVLLGGGASSRCIVDSIVKLTPEQAAAVPKELRP